MEKRTVYLGADASLDTSLKGWKAVSLQLKENELTVTLKNGAQRSARVAFIGVIGFQAGGLIGKALGDIAIEDKGSFKIIRLRNRLRQPLFTCECMEAAFSPPGGLSQPGSF